MNGQRRIIVRVPPVKMEVEMVMSLTLSLSWSVVTVPTIDENIAGAAGRREASQGNPERTI